MIDCGDRWSLSSDDPTVTRISLGWAMTLTIGSTEPQIDVRIEQPFDLIDSDGVAVQLVPEGDPVAMSPVLSIGRRMVERMDAFNDGRLEIEISDGVVVRVESSEMYEAWEISAAGGFRIVSTPGGGLAVWKGTVS